MFGFGVAAGCGGDPCKKLEEEVCKADAACIKVYKENVGKAYTTKEQCDAVLKAAPASVDGLKQAIEAFKKAGDATKAAEPAK